MVAQAAGGSKVVQREGPWPRQSGILEKVALTWKGQGVGRADIGHSGEGPGGISSSAVSSPGGRRGARVGPPAPGGRGAGFPGV